MSNQESSSSDSGSSEIKGKDVSVSSDKSLEVDGDNDRDVLAYQQSQSQPRHQQQQAWSPSRKHGLSLLDTRISDRPADYEPPACLRGPPPPDLFLNNTYDNMHDHDHDNHAGPSTSSHSAYSSERSRRRRLSLADFRRSEGPQIRSAKLQALWTSLPDDLPAPSPGPTPTSLMHLPGQGTIGTLSPERVERLRRLYEEELSRRISLEERESARLWGGADDLPEPNASAVATTSSSTSSSTSSISSVNAVKKGIKWKDFRRFLWDQEEQLWDIFCDLDRDGDGRLDHKELKGALSRSGIQMTDSTLFEFVQFLSSSSPASRPECQPKDNPQRERERKKTQQERTFITFAEFRDFLLLLPRKASVAEIYKYYQVRKRINDGRGAARLNMDGDLSVSFPKPSSSSTTGQSSASSSNTAAHPQVVSGSHADTRAADKASPPGHQKHAVISCKDREAGMVDGYEVCEDNETQGITEPSSKRADCAQSQHMHDDDEEEEEEGVNGIGADVAWKFLLAGGIAGAVSRTATAPFDRLKVYLITSTPVPAAMRAPADPKAPVTMTSRMVEHSVKYGSKGVGYLVDAATRIYRDGGGARAFWVGNGLNVTKIFPESAIKFFSYEYSKRFLARYWDHVADQTEISGTSRFISGGIGGITSQLMIYPVETLKTQLQSNLNKEAPPTKGAIVESAMIRTAKGMWKRGGMRAYYRGLTLGLIGVFPYSAIDMSTFEALKIAYCKSFGLEEPQTVAVLCFGALSGSIGATSVYPINLLRTRLQASGSPGHPQVYTGFRDVLSQTLQREGWFGLYKGLIPTLAKVVPAVSISYVVYEHSKRSLHLS